MVYEPSGNTAVLNQMESETLAVTIFTVSQVNNTIRLCLLSYLEQLIEHNIALFEDWTDLFVYLKKIAASLFHMLPGLIPRDIT